MGRHFGNLGVRVSGIIYYSLSPHEQRAFAGILSKGIPNTIKRIQSQFLKVFPPLFGAYLLYDYGEKENARLSRKNPKDYENET